MANILAARRLNDTLSLLGKCAVASSMESATFTCTLVEATPCQRLKEFGFSSATKFLRVWMVGINYPLQSCARSPDGCSGPEVKSANIHPLLDSCLLGGVGSESSKHACKGDLCRFLFLREAEKAEEGGMARIRI